MKGTDEETVRTFDLNRLPDSFYLDPYPTYRALRTFAPVHLCPDGTYFLTGHQDVNQIYRDPKLFSSDKQQQFKPIFGDGPLYEHHTTSLVFNDPPLHTNVRKAIGDALSRKVVRSMEPVLVELVDGLLDNLESKQEFDLMPEFASAIPIEVIGNLMDIDHGDRDPLQRWSNAILGALEFGLTDEALKEGNDAVSEFIDFLKVLIAARRKRGHGEDIISRLIRWESPAFRLSEFQIYHQCIFLLNAGHETTTNLIGNGTLALLDNPPVLALLRRRPELIGAAVEEILRFESPVQLGNRITTRAAKVGGVAVPAGATLTLCIGGANRDPAVFPSPDAFDISRDAVAHNAFGGGVHTCAGLGVARLEGKIAIGRLIERFPNLRLAGQPVRAKRARFRGFVELPLAQG